MVLGVGTCCLDWAWMDWNPVNGTVDMEIGVTPCTEDAPIIQQDVSGRPAHDS